MSQDKFSNSYKNMMTRVNSATRERRLNAIKTFYNIAEPVHYDQLKVEVREQIESSSDERVLSLCIELCTEAINRDFVSFVSTGKEGVVGRTVYASLL